MAIFLVRNGTSHRIVFAQKKPVKNIWRRFNAKLLNKTRKLILVVAYNLALSCYLIVVHYFLHMGLILKEAF